MKAAASFLIFVGILFLVDGRSVQKKSNPDKILEIKEILRELKDLETLENERELTAESATQPTTDTGDEGNTGAGEQQGNQGTEDEPVEDEATIHGKIKKIPPGLLKLADKFAGKKMPPGLGKLNELMDDLSEKMEDIEEEEEEDTENKIGEDVRATRKAIKELYEIIDSADENLEASEDRTPAIIGLNKFMEAGQHGIREILDNLADVGRDIIKIGTPSDDVDLPECHLDKAEEGDLEASFKDITECFRGGLKDLREKLEEINDMAGDKPGTVETLKMLAELGKAARALSFQMELAAEAQRTQIQMMLEELIEGRMPDVDTEMAPGGEETTTEATTETTPEATTENETTTETTPAETTENTESTTESTEAARRQLEDLVRDIRILLHKRKLTNNRPFKKTSSFLI